MASVPTLDHCPMGPLGCGLEGDIECAHLCPVLVTAAAAAVVVYLRKPGGERVAGWEGGRVYLVSILQVSLAFSHR